MTAAMEDAAPGALCRRVIRGADRAALATTAAKGKGGVDGPWAYASLVLAACDCDASPLLLVSDLADHTRDLRADPRVALLYDGTGGRDEALSGPRVALQGRAEAIGDDRLLERYLRRHPMARRYAGFRDFHLFRVSPVRAHLVAGFGVIEWLDAAELMMDPAACRALADAESDVLSCWNEAHADLFDLYARGLLCKRGKGWRAVGLDPEGIDISRDGSLARVAFRAAVTTPEEALAELRQRVGAG